MQEIYECSFVHNYFYYYTNLEITHKRIKTRNIYYINILPCLPGFFLCNGKCNCHPKLNHILQMTSCCIEDQTVYRPGTVWMMYSTSTQAETYMLTIVHFTIACHLHNIYSLQMLINSAIPIEEEFYVENVLKDIVLFLGQQDVRNGWLASIGIFIAIGFLLLLITMIDK